MGKYFVSKSNKKIPHDLKYKLDNVLTKIEQIYPERIIVYFKRDQSELSTKIRILRQEAGYSDNKELFEDFGFQYVDINKLNYDVYENVDEIQSVIERINNDKTKQIETKSEKISAYEDQLLPLDNYFYDNCWHSNVDAIKVDNSIQDKINYICNRLLEFYPKRIIFNLYSLHRKFVEKNLLAIKNYFKLDSYKELVEAFGFIMVIENQNKNHQSNKKILDTGESCDINLVMNNHGWTSISGKSITRNHQNLINCIFDIAYAIYPDRHISDLSLLNSIFSFNDAYNKVLKEMNYKNPQKLFYDFGFYFDSKLEIKHTVLPDIIYSNDKKIVYKVFTNKSKIALDEKVCLIKTGAFEQLPIETLDLSLISEKQVVLEKDAFKSCYAFEKIINPKAIQQCSYDSIEECEKLMIDKIYEQLQIVDDNFISLYEVIALGEDGKLIRILSNKMFKLGSYIKKHKKDDCYLVLKNKYASIELLNYLDLSSNYSYVKNKKNKLIVDYDLGTPIDLKDHETLINLYFNYCSDREEVLFYDGCSEKIDVNSNGLIKIPQFHDNQFIEYKLVSKNSIINEENYSRIETSDISKTYNLKIAIVGINLNFPFMKYKNFIYNPLYIKTFLKFHKMDAAIFFNSKILSLDRRFLKIIYSLFPHTDRSLIPNKYEGLF